MVRKLGWVSLNGQKGGATNRAKDRAVQATASSMVASPPLMVRCATASRTFYARALMIINGDVDLL